MARIRTTKPEFWTSEQVVECSRDARLMFLGMWNFCDDSGVIQASEKGLKMKVFPAEDDIDSASIRRMVDELIANDLLEEYTVGNKQFWRVTGWAHQKIDQPTYKFPLPDGKVPQNVRRTNGEGSPPEGKGKEGKGKDNKTPLPKDFGISERVEKWADEKGHARLTEHLEAFKLKAQAKGYKYTDWDAAFMEAVRKNWAGLTEKSEPFDPRDYCS